MQGLPLLIRLARQRADERRIALATAEQARLAGEAALAHQAEEVAAEQAQVRQHPASLGDWAAWSRAAARRRGRLLEGLALLRAQEAAAREALRAEFAEVKRLELALQARRQAALRQAARKAELRAEDSARLARRPD
ncbi:hypothetical protein [Pseudoroseomonas sp. WGS1072]|uniref:hypothetical protein n=1 Tax=Roseomonas sp. WGS1072 TaxID=3366816 RepID=UPI003BF0DF38